LGPPHESNFEYAIAKRQVDSLNRMYNKRCATRVDNQSLFFSVIPTNIYGPHDNFDPDQSHVVPGLIYRAYKQSVDHSTNSDSQTAHLIVFGSGKPLRQFIYGRDLAKLILWALDRFVDVQEPLLIMCAGDGGKGDYAELSIGQVAEIICKIFSERFRLELRPKFDASKSDGQFRKAASNEKLLRLIDDFKFTPIERGLRETIDWFCSRYPNVRGLS
jgi:GDP-L-fucose synthase